jgi:hypothetical protein
MRAMLAVAITAAFVLVAWRNYWMVSADAGPNVAKSSIDSSVPDMPQPQYVGP